MDFLKYSSFYCVLFFISAVQASLTMQEVDPYSFIQNDKKKDANYLEPETREEASRAYRIRELESKVKETEIPFFCDTAKEFKETYEELLANKLTEFSDKAIIQISYEVTKGCDGASARFMKILTLLLKSGVDRKKSVQIALHFAKKTEGQSKAFIALFQGTFLEKYYDMDFKTAINTSLNLALNARGEPDTVAADFRGIIDFCLNNQGATLPFKYCAPYSLELINHSYLFGKEGVLPTFKKIMAFFSEQKEIDYSLSTQLKFTAKIIRYGPKAYINFENQYKFGISDKMHLSQKNSAALAVKVAEQTLGKILQ